MSEKPGSAADTSQEGAAATYSGAEVEELRLQYRDEALKAVDAARQRALAEAREHFQDTIRFINLIFSFYYIYILLNILARCIRRLEEDRDRLAASLAQATAKIASSSSNTTRDLDGDNVCMTCGANSNASNSAIIKSTMEKVRVLFLRGHLSGI
jgi:hypothetical protein